MSFIPLVIPDTSETPRSVTELLDSWDHHDDYRQRLIANRTRLYRQFESGEVDAAEYHWRNDELRSSLAALEVRMGSIESAITAAKEA